ncbi:MAG: twin-arginine translocation signal domain-containing protein [Bacillati bacterium ANGP1]|uniref:Twin-arginine translocation signal domain-containing protein n=1 Tax=Candidatus Segetimicrobium genomatis TaxID=2569760 RepID=A0A537JNE6_9BACT|nr:MAG: twin-arginine translocation signal domain-containing protein [Terrabacteria group bacterium ANGP1]
MTVRTGTPHDTRAPGGVPRITRRRFLGTALGAGLGGAALAAPLPNPLGAAPADRVLRWGQSEADLGTADPHYAAATQDRVLVDLIFNGLLRFKPGDGSTFEPDLALEFPKPVVIAGKQVWTFKLRKGVLWHPSDKVPSYELTSEDVAYSLGKSADRARSAYSALYGGMTFHAPDPYTVSIVLDTAVSPNLFYPLVTNYAGGFIMSKRAVEAYGLDGVKTHPVGTGPFILRRYSPKEKVDLAPNPTYFRGRPKLDGIDYRYMADGFSRELGLRGGQLDGIAGTQDEAWVDKMQAVPKILVDIFGVGESTVLYFNQTIRPLSLKPVRQAIAYALNRDEFLALIGKKIAQKIYAPLAPFTIGALTEQEVTSKGLDYKTSLEKARGLLAEAGMPGGFSVDLVTSELGIYKIHYESMQAQLSKIGITIRLRVVDHPSYHALIRKDANPIVIYVAFRPTADIYLRSFYHSASTVVTGAHPDTNFAHYAGVDDLIDRARVETSAVRQVELWKEAQIKILQDMAAYPVSYANQVYARASGLDYGHALKSVLALYPGIDETTQVRRG